LEVDFLIRPHQGWAPQRNPRHVRKKGAQTQHKARPQVGRPNATQGTSASWAPQRTSATQTQDTQRKARPHVRKLGAPTQRKACPQDGRPNTKLIRNESVHTREHWAKSRAGGWIRTNFGLEVDFLIRPHGTSATQGTSASWAAQRTSATQTQGTSASWAAQRTSATQTQGTSAIWAPQRNARHVRKMVAQTQNSSTTKTSTQGSTRLKDELEDG
jgi:hypothetical protein